MPIPQPHDYKIAEADQLAQSVQALLQGLAWGHAHDIRLLRERLQQYVDVVMETAHAIIDANVE